MNNNTNFQITKDGLEALKTELAELTEAKRPGLVERLANARLQGDLTENSDYQNAKDELEFLDGRISELEEVIKNAVISNGSGNGSVAVGAKVTVKLNGKDMVFTIVGEWEADPAKQMISHTSPLGQALSGKKVGDRVEVEAPAGKIVYEIISVE